jgi:hypothetical protein
VFGCLKASEAGTIDFQWLNTIVRGLRNNETKMMELLVENVNIVTSLRPVVIGPSFFPVPQGLKEATLNLAIHSQRRLLREQDPSVPRSLAFPCNHYPHSAGRLIYIMVLLTERCVLDS